MYYLVTGYISWDADESSRNRKSQKIWWLKKGKNVLSAFINNPNVGRHSRTDN